MSETAVHETEVHVLKHQMYALESQKQEVFLGGGVGAGKTQVGSLWAVQKIMETPNDVYGLVVSNTYSQLYDTTVRALYDRFRTFGFHTRPFDTPRGKGPADILIWNGSSWVKMLLRSLDHYERLSGIEVGWIWADETWLTKQEAIDILNARLRDIRMPHRQILYTTTLDSPDTWMYQRFVENYSESLMDVIYAKTQDNPYLPENYVDQLKASYSENVYRRMVLSEWVALDSERVYNSFKRDMSVGECEYSEQLPLLWTHDFNIGWGKPMSSCIVQYHHNSETFCVLDEIILDRSDTNDAISEFRSRFGNVQNVVIYGDASGNSRDTRSRMTDYEILRKNGFTNQRVPRSNPPLRERHNIVNSICCDATGRSRLLINPRCKTLIKGMETTQLRKGASYVEDDSNPSQHVTTALGYLLCVESPNRPATLKQLRVQY